MSMKKSIKAALLSGLVLPGAGYFALKRPLRGVVVLVLSTASLVYLINSAMQQAALLMDKAMSGDMPLDAAGIEKMISATPAGASEMLGNIATFLLIACWLFSIVDGYRIGRDEDRKADQKADQRAADNPPK
jgi:hypothetical protein